MITSKLKKSIYIFMIICVIINCCSINAFAENNNIEQIVIGSTMNPENGELNSDGVKVSKTLIPTDKENQFDVELSVTTTTKIEELYKESDAAVIIVMDISYTMRSNFTGTTTPKYLAALAAAEEFVKDFGTYSDGSSALRKIGFAAFNTHGHEILDLTDCKTESDATAIFDEVEEKITDTILSVNSSNHDRFTNIEAGLLIGRSMLDEVDTDKKYLIFISDGLPTTYVSSGYTGYDPYDSSGTRFKNRKTNKPCSYGTNYSDEAAYRAEIAADAIKADTKIFSIGVDIDNQTVGSVVYGDTHDANGNAVTKSFSVIDCYASGDYVIGSDADGFKNWLRDEIGSGYYYDSDDQDEIESAIIDIFNVMKEEDKISVENSWVTADALNDSITPDNIKFMYFYDKDGYIVGTSLSGETGENLENTANYSDDTDAISWDLKYSGYESVVNGNITNYTYKLKYRLRLMNEVEPFLENESYVTNGPTSLTYQVRTNNGLSSIKTIDFIIPSVKGYIGSLSSIKMSNKTGLPLKDAEFTLSHKGTNCPICEGVVEINDFVITSNEEGIFNFNKIPSGHEYYLFESLAPEGYLLNEIKYNVAVNYGIVTSDVPEQIINFPIPISNFELLINKTLISIKPTNEIYTFTFAVDSCDESGMIISENVFNETIDISNSESKTKILNINFEEEDLINGEIYNFRIYEVNDNLFDVFYDTNYYIVSLEIVHSAPEIVSVKKFNADNIEDINFEFSDSLNFENYAGLSNDTLPNMGGNGTEYFKVVGLVIFFIGLLILSFVKIKILKVFDKVD